MDFKLSLSQKYVSLDKNKYEEGFKKIILA